MISCLYSVIDGLCFLFLISILLNSISVSKSINSGKIFIVFLCFAILFECFDFLWGLSYSVFYHNKINLNYITYINLFLSSAAVIGWVVFSFSFLGKKIKNNYQIYLFLFIYVIHNIFLLKDILQNSFSRNAFFGFHFIVFLVLSIIVLIDLLKEKEKSKKKYISTILVLSLISLITTILQNLFLAVPVYTMCITYSSFIIYSRIITYEASKNLAKYQSIENQLKFQETQRRDLSIISSLSGNFDFLSIINSKENTIKPLRVSGIFKKYLNYSNDTILPAEFDEMIKTVILKETFPDFLKNINRDKIMKMLDNGERFSIEFSSNEDCDFHHYKISFVKDLDCQDMVLIGIKDIENEYSLRKELETQKTYITDLKVKNEIAMYMASIDGLTGLLNKISFMEKVEEYLMNHSSKGSSLIFIDMDHFKSINDVFGHSKGDEALKKMSKRLKSMFRSNELIGRIGGDEFCVFLPSVTKEILEERLEEMNIKLNDIYANNSVTINTTASIGCVYCVSENMNFVELHNQADKIMYEVKNNGRNNYILKEF